MSLSSRYSRRQLGWAAGVLVAISIVVLAVGILVPQRYVSQDYEKNAQQMVQGINAILATNMAQLQANAQSYSISNLYNVEHLKTALAELQKRSPLFTNLYVVDSYGAVAGTVYPLNAISSCYVYGEEMALDFLPQDTTRSCVILGAVKEVSGRSWNVRAILDFSLVSLLLQVGTQSIATDSFIIDDAGKIVAGPWNLVEKFAGLPPKNPFDFLPEHGTYVFKDHIFYVQRIEKLPWRLVVAKKDEGMEFGSSMGFMLISLLVAFACLLGALLILFRVRNTPTVEVKNETFTHDPAFLELNKLATMGELAAGVMHDVRNPLMMIAEYAAWMKDLLSEESPEHMQYYNELSEAVRKIERHVGRISAMSDRVLRFSRKTGTLAALVPVNQLVEDAVEFAAHKFAQHSTALEKRYAVDEPMVYADPGLLEQVVFNVLDNAVDATGTGGRVRISTGVKEGVAFIRIVDNGPGIPDEKLQKVFEPFYTTKGPGQGTGLGLSICASIMEHLGGSIRAENLRKRGCAITIFLPQAQ